MPQGITWTAGEKTLTCTVCRHSGVGDYVATISRPPLENIDAIRCRHCESLYLLANPLDFSSTPEQVAQYVETGAGIDAILHGVALAHTPDVRTFLDVGCNVGFAMDMGKFLFGWDVLGVEPSLAGKFGVDTLGLTIRNEYLTSETTLPHAFDAVFASEVLEHVPEPLPFLAAIRSHLSPHGRVILTTPAAEIVAPTESVQAVMAALSPGYHCFIASVGGLHLLLEQAGFVDITVERDAGTLRATARAAAPSPADSPSDPLAPPVLEPPVLEPQDLERYVRYRASTAAASSALECGMLLRLIRSLVARGAFAEALEVLPAFHRSFTGRHKVDLSRPGSIRLTSRHGRAALPTLAAPCYSLAMLELLSTHDYARAIAYFDLAENAIGTIERAQGSAGIEAEGLTRLIPFHRALAQAHVAPHTAAQTIVSPRLTPAQRCRVFVELIAQGYFDLPSDVIESLAATAPVVAQSLDEADRSAGLDALFQLGIFAANRGQGDQARFWFREIVHRCAPDDPATLAAKDQLQLLPNPTPHHMVDTYWRDAWGVYVDGWIHLEDLAITSIRVDFAGVSAPVTRHPREDLAHHWPDYSEVIDGGFRAYVAGGHGNEMTLILTTATGEHSVVVTLPDHPLPLQPEPTDGTLFDEALKERIAQAPPGPVLAIGMRSPSATQAAEQLKIFGEREVIRLDIHPGHGVDLVGDAHILSQFLPENHFAVVYSASVLEHLTAPWLMAMECSKILMMGGRAIHRAPWTWPTHSAPNDFFRFSPGGLAELFSSRFGFDVLESGGIDGVVVVPTPAWRTRNIRMPTLTSESVSWIVAQKVAEPQADKLWKYSIDAGGESAREYPLDGLAGEQ